MKYDQWKWEVVCHFCRDKYPNFIYHPTLDGKKMVYDRPCYLCKTILFTRYEMRVDPVFQSTDDFAPVTGI